MVLGEYVYQDHYLDLFMENYNSYKSLQPRIDKKMERILRNPYHNTEILGSMKGKINLKGCRSIRVSRNFRIIFVICEECRKIKEAQFCFCEGLPDKAVVFLTVGTHQRAYEMR